MGKPDFIAGEDENFALNKPPEEIVVHVTGEVKKPNVYRLEKGMRVADVIQLAGGATEKADLQQLNLAARAMDGEKIHVPAKLSTSSSQIIPKLQPSISKSSPETPKSHSNLSGKINLNTATAKELENLPGIGPVMSSRIIEHRSLRGTFYNIEEIKEVKGIGDKTYERIKNLIIVY